MQQRFVLSEEKNVIPMELPEKLVVTGFVLVMMGVAFLALIGVNEGSGFFFVFPFFAFVGTGEATIMPFIFTAVISIFLFGFFIYWSKNLLKESIEEREYALMMETECEYCDAPIPSGARYCPSCGKPIHDENRT